MGNAKRPVKKKDFGERLRTRRERLGMSQATLADAVGMKQQGVQNIEQGIVSRPRLLRELAAALLTTEDWLLWGEGPENAENQEVVEIVEILQRATPEQRRAALRYLRNLSGPGGKVA